MLTGSAGKRCPLAVRGAAVLIICFAAAAAGADEVIFLNGDRLTGKIVGAAAGKLTLKTEAAGEVTIDLSKVRTFSTDEPVTVKRTGDTPPLRSRVAAGPEGQVQTEPAPGVPAQPLAIKEIAVINPPAPAWHGSLALNGLLTTGNTETQQIGFQGALNKRWERDRLTFGASYTFGRQEDPDTHDKATTVDFGQISGKYDHFFTKKFYGFALARAEHDGVADLTYRFTPSLGVGYQWFETPTFNLSTEAGLVYVYEKYEDENAKDYLGPRLAYAVDWTPVSPLKLYHTLEYLPSFDDFLGDYLLNVAAGAKLKITKAFFGDFRYEFAYDSTPARGREKSDSRFLLGIGWEF